MSIETSENQFASIVESYRSRIDVELDIYTRFDSGCPEILQEAMRYSLLAPGKRLRPVLTLMAVDICGSRWELGLPAACAVEMIHCYSLIHDDLPAMDDDDLRRGRPTCHKQFGEANAILAGDALLARAFEVVAQDIQPSDCAARCCQELARAAGACHLVGGQVADLAAETQEPGTVAELEAIHRRKTGAMLRVALELGGRVGQASQEQLHALSQYGDHLGLAFQVVDDLLDWNGNEMELGKRTQKDAERGKMTYPRLMGVDASRARAEWLIREACDAIMIFGDRARDMISLAHYVLERKR